MIGNGIPKVVSISDANTFFKIGDRHWLNKKYNKAIKYLIKALKIEPNHIKVIELLALIHETLENYSEALTYYDKLLPFRKKDWTLINKMIRLSLMDKRYLSAADLIILRLDRFKGELSLWQRLKGFLSKDSYIHEEYCRASFQLAYIFREEENHKMALKYGKKLLRLRREAMSYYMLATIYEAKSDFTKAQKAFSKVKQSFAQITPELYEEVYIKMVESHLLSEAHVV